MRFRRMFILSPLRVSAFLHSLGPSRHFAAAQQTVAFGGIVLQNLNVFAEGGGQEFLRGTFFAPPMRELRQRHVGTTS